jgi:hypothetical protein
MRFSALRGQLHSSYKKWMILTGLLLASNFCLLVLWFTGRIQAGDHYLLELSQYSFLVIICSLSIRRVWRRTKISLNMTFLLHAGLALLSYSFLLRELDIDKFGASPAWAIFELALRLTGVILWLILLMFVLPRAAELWAKRTIMFTMPIVIMLILSGFFLLASWPFDKKVFSAIPYFTSQFIEEMLELNGYIVLFFSSLED